MIYASKKDGWVALLLLVISVMDFGIGGVMLYEAVVQAAPLPDLLFGLVPVLVAGLLLWIYASTGCDISPPHLVARSGPFRFTVPLDAIAEVKQTSRFSLELGWNFALSRDRLFIKYRKHDGRVALFGVAVSPEDQEGFLQELAASGARVEDRRRLTAPGEVSTSSGCQACRTFYLERQPTRSENWPAALDEAPIVAFYWFLAARATCSCRVAPCPSPAP